MLQIFRFYSGQRQILVQKCHHWAPASTFPSPSVWMSLMDGTLSMFLNILMTMENQCRTYTKISSYPSPYLLMNCPRVAYFPSPGFGRPHLVLEATLPYGLAMI